jgi:hypothetical protein
MIARLRKHGIPPSDVTPEQRKFLQDRLRKAMGEQPDLGRLKTILLRFGGTF